MRKSRVLIACWMLGCGSVGGETPEGAPKPSMSGVMHPLGASLSGHAGEKASSHDFVTIHMLKDDHQLPMVIESWQGTFDQSAQHVWLPKRTTLWQGRGQLSAQQCWYDVANQQLRARGDVVLRHEDGTIALCQALNASLKEHKGVASGIHVVTPQQWRLSAQKMTHTPDETQWKWGSFTPCAVCKVTDFPLWSLHAKNMTWKRSHKRLYCQKAALRVLGRPVMALPSVSFATSRASGWLIPRLGQAQPLGWFLGTPYFIDLSPEQDLTLTPFVTTKAGIMASGHYRAHTALHRTSIQGAYTYGPDQHSISAKPIWSMPLGSRDLMTPLGEIDAWRAWHANADDLSSSRGFFHGESQCRLHDTMRLSVNQWWISDDSFLASRPLFGHTQDAYLPSWVQVQHLTPQGYGSLRTLRYRSLQPVWQQTSVHSWVAPEFSYTWTPDMVQGSGHQVSARLHGIGEAAWNAQRMRRLASDVQWSHVMAGPYGQRHEIQARMIGVAYALSLDGGEVGGHPRGGWMAPEGAFDASSGSPKALSSMVTWTSRFPLIMAIGGVMTPVIQVVGSPSLIQTKTSPPNLDSQCVWFDETNVFQDQRFGGYDRLDDHSRLNGGVEWAYSPTSDIDIHAIVAQSYAWQPPNPALLPVGVRQGASDVIASTGIHCHGLDGLYRMRVDPTTHHVTMQEMAWSAGPERARITGSYLYQHNDLDSAHSRFSDHASRNGAIKGLMPVNQWTLQVTSAWTDRWSTSLFGTYDLGSPISVCKGQEPTSWRDMGGEISYVNECLSVHLTVQKSYYVFQDIKPGWTISLSLLLKAISSQSPANRRFDHRIFP